MGYRGEGMGDMHAVQPSAAGLIAANRVEGDYFFHHLHPDREEGLEVICCGRERCLAGYCVERKHFPYLAIEYVAAGEGWLRLGDLELPLSAGSLYVYGPAMPHRLEARSDGLIKYFVDFAGSRAESLLDAQGLGPGVFQTLGSRRWTCDLFDQLIACSSLRRDKAAVIAPRLLELLLLRIGGDVPVPAGPDRPSASAATFARCREFLREHHARLTKVEEAAAGCGVSSAYLVRLFQRHSPESAYHFLTRLKMENAADLLLTRSFSVKRVASRVGYADPYHFSRVFKRYHGVAPKLFRDEFHRLPSGGEPVKSNRRQRRDGRGE